MGLRIFHLEVHGRKMGKMCPSSYTEDMWSALAIGGVNFISFPYGEQDDDYHKLPKEEQEKFREQMRKDHEARAKKLERKKNKVLKRGEVWDEEREALENAQRVSV